MKKGAIDISTMVYGKLPPQAKDIEEAILGAIMLEKDAFDRATQLMTPECFYVEAHQRIFRSMKELANKSQPIDSLTVSEQLRVSGELDMVGGPYYVEKLTNSVVSSAHTEHHCRIVYEKFLKRELIRIGGEMIGEAYEDGSDPFDLKDESEKKLSALNGHTSGSNIRELSHVAVDRFLRIVALRKNDSHLTGISSGFHSLDRITHGWQNTDLIILAARPAVGKTAFALNIARNAAKSTHPMGGKVKVALFSLEMSTGQLVDRMMSCESEVPLDKIMTGRIDDNEQRRLHDKGLQPFSQMGIFIDDTPAITVFDLRRKFRYIKRRFSKEGDQWVIILDYLQLMSGTGDKRSSNRENDIATISRNLKAIAKEENVPIIALSQLSRAVETRTGEKKVPVLSDLRESGAIEQDADMVMFMYRPEYYDIQNTEMGESIKGLTEISIAKHRNGSLAQGNEAIKLKALLYIQKFIEWEGNIEPYVAPGSGWRPVRDVLPKENDL
jgi:replicative DNA helicase